MIDDNQLEKNINEGLDDSIESLSPEIRRCLNQSRINAVEKKAKVSSYFKLASAISFTLVIGLSWPFFGQGNQDMVTPFAEILQEDLDILDDLEFVYWMTEEKISAAL
jgi:hypothetical protein